jgi:hypothetical protein
MREAEETAVWQVKPVPRRAGPTDTTITIPPRHPLYCAVCGSENFMGVRAANTKSGWEVDCPRCEQWQEAKEECNA